MADSCGRITCRMQVMQVALQASADGPACIVTCLIIYRAE
jgi:hypothetical protein